MLRADQTPSSLATPERPGRNQPRRGAARAEEASLCATVAGKANVRFVQPGGSVARHPEKAGELLASSVLGFEE